MRFRCNGGKILFLAAVMALGASFSPSPAHATSPQGSSTSQAPSNVVAEPASLLGSRSGSRLQIHYSRIAFPGRVTRDPAERGHVSRLMRGYAFRRPTLQCVAFARSASNIALSGNAANWWDNAAGVYSRGQRPVPGSVLAFTANGHMPLGHVAVVSRMVNGREIEIDHANWAGAGAYRGGVARGVMVVDVSERNDWTAVRVAIGQSGDFGSVYPTYGFIYDQADTGMRVASVETPAPVPVLNPAPSDLRRVAFGRTPQVGQAVAYDGYEEVAEAPRALGAWHPRVYRHR